MDSEQMILTFIAKVITYGGGGAAVAYGIFRIFTEKWLDNRFAERLEALRHSQSKELEDVRYKINALFDRVTKIHEKEFEVLPEAWSRLTEALAHVAAFVSHLQRYPDLDQMSQPELEAFLSKSRLDKIEKEKLIASTSRLGYYRERIFWYQLFDVNKFCREFHVYIQKNSIFLSEDLKENFTKIDDLMWSCIIDREIGHEAKDHKIWISASKRVRDEAEPLKKNIEALVQQRLKYEKAE